MSVRRTSREWAVQLLFQLDLNPSNELDAAFDEFWSTRESDRRSRGFAESIVRGVTAHAREINELVSRYAAHWSISRIGPVERNVMRMAVYEIYYCPDIPDVVAINEAVDIAKYFSTTESGRFVNGVLDRIRKERKHDDG